MTSCEECAGFSYLDTSRKCVKKTKKFANLGQGQYFALGACPGTSVKLPNGPNAVLQYQNGDEECVAACPSGIHDKDKKCMPSCSDYLKKSATEGDRWECVEECDTFWIQDGQNKVCVTSCDGLGLISGKECVRKCSESEVWVPDQGQSNLGQCVKITAATRYLFSHVIGCFATATNTGLWPTAKFEPTTTVGTRVQEGCTDLGW